LIVTIKFDPAPAPFSVSGRLQRTINVFRLRCRLELHELAWRGELHAALT